MVRLTGAIALCAAAVAVGASCGPVCGPGTIEQDGQCVPVGEGEGEGEGEGLVCGVGTVATNGVCVPLCRADQVRNNNACACPAGQAESNGTCSPDPGLCAPGTILDGRGVCVPVAPAAPGDNDAAGPVDVTLPAVGQSVTIGGVIDSPSAEAPFDTFAFAGTAGTRLRIQVVSFGADNAAFAVDGIRDIVADNNIESFQRIALPRGGRRAVREVVLPLNGDYAVTVGDKSLFDSGLLSSGGDGQTYNLVIETLAPQTPSLLGATAATGLQPFRSSASTQQRSPPV